MWKLLHTGLIVAGSILFLSLVLLIVVLINSPGTPRQFLSNDGEKVPGSIAIIETVNINGMDQRMIIRGRDTTKPVLLYLHGGPGTPEFPFVRQFNSGIEDLFVVCYWDQRGSGLSYAKNIPSTTMTLQQFVEDAARVSEYLINKFNREKIYLLGHSWGTMLGSYTVHKYSEYFYAFISVGQVAEQIRSENISYNFVLEKARESQDKSAVRELEKIGPPPYYDQKEAIDKMIIERKYVTQYGGAVKKGNLYPQAIKSMFYCREYSLRDKINFIKGMRFTLNYLWDVIQKSNLFKDIPSQKIPVYIIHGTSDYQTSYTVAKEYFDSLQAPVKRFFAFENSAHSPIFEEPEKFEMILREILLEQKGNEKQ